MPRKSKPPCHCAANTSVGGSAQKPIVLDDMWGTEVIQPRPPPPPKPMPRPKRKPGASLGRDRAKEVVPKRIKRTARSSGGGQGQTDLEDRLDYAALPSDTFVSEFRKRRSPATAKRAGKLAGLARVVRDRNSSEDSKLAWIARQTEARRRDQERTQGNQERARATMLRWKKSFPALYEVIMQSISLDDAALDEDIMTGANVDRTVARADERVEWAEEEIPMAMLSEDKRLKGEFDSYKRLRAQLRKLPSPTPGNAASVRRVKLATKLEELADNLHDHVKGVKRALAGNDRISRRARVAAKAPAAKSGGRSPRGRAVSKAAVTRALGRVRSRNTS